MFVPFLKQTRESLSSAGLPAHTSSCLVWGQVTLTWLQHFVDRNFSSFFVNHSKAQFWDGFLSWGVFPPLPNQFIFLIPSSLFGAHIHQSKSPVAASSYRRGCGRPRTWQPGALAWKQRQAEDTRGGCGRQGRTGRSRRSHSQAEKHTHTHRMCHPLKESPSQLLYSWFLTESTLLNTTSVPECLFKSIQIRSSLMYTKISRL